MSENNKKIKSITITSPVTTTYYDSLGCSICKDGEEFRIEQRYLILIVSKEIVKNIEYEPPTSKNNVLYELVEPEYNQPYCYVDSDGEVAHSGLTNSRIDNLRFNLNNVFLTEANAQKQADRLKLLAEIQRFADLNNEPVELLMFDYITYSTSQKAWSKDTNGLGYIIPTRFTSKSLMIQALEKFQDRLNILLD